MTFNFRRKTHSFFFFFPPCFSLQHKQPLKLQHLLLCAGLFPHWHTTTILSATNRICFSLRPFVAVQAPLLPSRCAARCLREQWRSASGFENISLYIPPTPSPEKHWCLFTFFTTMRLYLCDCVFDCVFSPGGVVVYCRRSRSIGLLCCLLSVKVTWYLCLCVWESVKDRLKTHRGPPATNTANKKVSARSLHKHSERLSGKWELK